MNRRELDVAQIWNLLYRRIAFCSASAKSKAPELSAALPIANRRYGRLKICATNTQFMESLYALLARIGTMNQPIGGAILPSSPGKTAAKEVRARQESRPTLRIMERNAEPDHLLAE
ncbi:MAG: hypothetical protein HY735_30235 [Verrucomicrobia bacterium]|nr:hypothetical protein [Verrucomicrobiota bacterium]